MAEILFTWNGVAWVPSGFVDHGALLGLTDDDHQQYLLIDGTRAMTGPLDMGSQQIRLDGTADNMLVFTAAGSILSIVLNSSALLKLDDGASLLTIDAGADVTGRLNTDTGLTVNSVAAQSPMQAPVGLSMGNLTDVTSFANGSESHALYLGRSLKVHTTATVVWRVTTAVTGVGRTCQVGIFKATINAGGAPGTLTRICTVADIKTECASTGIKSKAITLLGQAAGDDLWLVIQAGKNAGAAQFRAMLADDIQSGVFGLVAPGTNINQATLTPTLATATEPPSWLRVLFV